MNYLDLIILSFFILIFLVEIALFAIATKYFDNRGYRNYLKILKKFGGKLNDEKI